MEISKLSLNAGELSDEIAGRIDLSKFNTGCEVLENARVLRAGGVTRRAGMRYVGDTLLQDRKTRIVGFRFSEAQGYVLELSHHTMRVLHGGEILPTVYETPWTEDQVFQLQFAQRIDRIVVTHPEVPVHNIIRFNDGTWGVSELPWQDRVWEPFPSESDIVLTPDGVDGDTTITSSSPIFSDEWVGDRIRIDHTVEEAQDEYTVSNSLNGNRTFDPDDGNYTVGDVVSEPADDGRNYFTAIEDYSGVIDFRLGENRLSDYPDFFQEGVVLVPPTFVESGWVFETFGTWTGRYLVQRSYNEGATWDTIRVVTSTDNRNERIAESEDQAGLVRVLVSEYQNDLNERVEFTVNNYTSSGVAMVTSVNSSTEVDVTVEQPFQNTQSSTNWFEEAFSPRNGYPVGVTFYQSRLCLAGTRTRPQTLWLSQTERPFDFGFGTLATDGMSFQTDAEGYESITWLSSHLSLLVGTTLGVWAVSAPDGSSLSPENNTINRQMQIGAQQGFQAYPVQNNVLFLQYKGRKIQELTGGSVEYGGYLSSDLTQLATHVTRQGVKQLCTGELPDSSLFLVNGGEVPVLTYERSQNVVGWARWTTDGEIQSMTTTSGRDEDDDHYFVVDRGGIQTIEFLAPDMLRIEEANDVKNLRFLDSYVERIENENFSSVSGLDRFNGREVEMFIDGEPQGSKLVENGEVILPREGKNVAVGLPYVTEIRPMSLDFGAIGSRSSMIEIVVRFRNSLGGEVSQDRKSWSLIEQMQPRITVDEPLSLLSEDFKSTPHSTWERRPSMSIRQNQPLPMTVLAMRVKAKTQR